LKERLRAQVNLASYLQQLFQPALKPLQQGKAFIAEE
jgi:hypothetical protein